MGNVRVRKKVRFYKQIEYNFISYFLVWCFNSHILRIKYACQITESIIICIGVYLGGTKTTTIKCIWCNENT